MTNPLRLLVLFLLLLLLNVAASRAATLTNFQLQDSLMKRAALDLRSHLQAAHSVPLRIHCSDHPARWLVEQHVRAALQESSLYASDSSAAVLEIGIADFAVRYAPASDRDSLIRTIHLVLRCATASQQLPEWSAAHTDVIARSEQSLLENPGYAFCSGTAPPIARSTWDDILEPVVVLAALATTVVVLFSVRSQ